MTRKTFIIAKREYLESVKRKGFIIGLLIMPIIMAGGFFGLLIVKNQKDTVDKTVAVIDHTEQIFPVLLEKAARYNEEDIFDDEGNKVKAAYSFELIDTQDSDVKEMRLDLSDQVKAKKYHAFLEIGPNAIHPVEDSEGNAISYHAENALVDDLRGWLNNRINQEIRRIRMEDAGVDLEAHPHMLDWMDVSAMGLLSRDESSGEIADARKSGEAEAIWIPFALLMLMYIMVMFGAMPMINSVMEEKNQHIAEIILGSVKPFDFMFGKVLGGVAVSLTASAVYLGGTIFFLFNMGKADIISFSLIIWFLTFLILCSLMMGSIMTAVGSACSDLKDAQNLTLPAMTPIMVPLFIWLPLVLKPASMFSVIISLVPCFTPMLMTARMATPASIPLWQPVLGLLLTTLFTLFVVWIGGRIFRIGILTQGKAPKLKNLINWAVKG